MNEQGFVTLAEGNASAAALSWPAPGARPINCDQVARAARRFAMHFPELQGRPVLYEPQQCPWRVTESPSSL